MTITDIKDLEAVIKLCRKQNVDIIKIDNVEIVLGKAPTATPKRRRSIIDSAQEPANSFDPGKIDITPLNIPTDELTDEQILFGSSDPTVWDNSANQ